MTISCQKFLDKLRKICQETFRHEIETLKVLRRKSELHLFHI